jgi:hypothetical protein
MATITAANSVFMLQVNNLYNIPVQMQGYAADDAFASEDVEFMEKYMGVDGRLSVGFTPYIIPLDFNLQADSASNAIMDAIISTEKTLREKLVLHATIILPSTGYVYNFSTGYLDKGPVMPSAGKVLKPRKYSLAFQDLSVAPV